MSKEVRIYTYSVLFKPTNPLTHGGWEDVTALSLKPLDDAEAIAKATEKMTFPKAHYADASVQKTREHVVIEGSPLHHRWLTHMGIDPHTYHPDGRTCQTPHRTFFPSHDEVTYNGLPRFPVCVRCGLFRFAEDDTKWYCGECMIDPTEDPAPWCDCRSGEKCKGPCRQRAHDPKNCPYPDDYLRVSMRSVPAADWLLPKS